MFVSRTTAHSTRRRAFRALSVAAVSVGLVVGVPATAYASTPYGQGCFTISPSTGLTTQTVWGYNNCSYTTGFRVYDHVPGFATQAEPCVRVAPHSAGAWKWTKGRKFDGTGLC